MRQGQATRERIRDLLPGLSRVCRLEERGVVNGPPVRSVLVCDVARWRRQVTPAARSIKGRENRRLTYVCRRRGIPVVATAPCPGSKWTVVPWPFESQLWPGGGGKSCRSQLWPASVEVYRWGGPAPRLPIDASSGSRRAM